ncbi:amidohydrolase family protein [Negadavirga shengliensis]|uniref:Amidohydrolase family protein n=1 Tax=Negadavirga shengliensis TaxID=1389218 RepID=A0ABV9T629_9BACT
MNKARFVFIILFFVLAFQGFSQIEGEVVKPVKGHFLLRNATLFTVTQGIKENTDLEIAHGKIVAIGQSLPIGEATVIDCGGKYIYPGFIDGGSRLGLVEVGSLAETQDYLEIGNVTPHMMALTAINPNSVAIPVTRVSGVTNTLTVPQGGYFPGTAALISLNGYTPDQMYAGYQGVVLRFPSTAKRSTYDNRSDETIRTEAEKALKNLNEIWERAETYHTLKQAGGELPYYPEMEQLSKAVSGELPLLLEVNSAKDIVAALAWLKDKNLDVILTGVSEGWRVADKIASAKLPVITGPVLSLPSRNSDRYDAAYTNAAKLHKAGVKVALRTDGAENVRNLPFNAGFAAAYGMGREEALKAITINPAEMFKVSDQLGSLETGKNATLFIADGDPFEPKTQIIHVFIDGYKIPMTNRHIRLYQEFLDRGFDDAE